MLFGTIPGDREKREYCGYVTDKWKIYREMAARKFGGEIVNERMPEGYCLIADGEDLIAVRCIDREEVFRIKDPKPRLEDWTEVYQIMFDKGLIDGFEFFSRCDTDYAARHPAIQQARLAAERDRTPETR